MGEVYRARDTKLNRQVAIKVLPELLASDAERLARLQREAQILASLNHPNIAAIYGLEHADGIHALVMELVEGEDLARRIEGGAIPFDEALPIARQIADALESAHEQGIIHRDLKPANIKLRNDGTVKVLDFGLAKFADVAGSAVQSPGLTQSPTITTPAMTAAGVILGTAAYMSPEQARGKPVDKRADIWAFGCVLFEMLTARRAFEGESISDVLASVLKTEPDWQALPPTTPGTLTRLLRRCLEKDPRRRLQAIGEARVQIEDLLSGSSPDDRVVVSAAATPRLRLVLPWSVAALGLIAATLTIALSTPRRSTSPAAPLRLSTALGADVSLTVGVGEEESLSPDGSLIVFVAQKTQEQSPQLFLRRLAELQATALPGTDGAESPFFSPDGQWVAFFAGGKLKKMAITGGSAVTLCDATNGRGGTWIEDGTIIFSPAQGGGLVRVSADGGTVEPVTSLAAGELTHRWPQGLPGGKAVLFTVNGVGTGMPGTASYDDATIVAQTLPAGTRTIVQRGGYHGRYVASGHVIYLHDGTLFAVPFDLQRLTTTGSPVPMVEGVISSRTSGGSQFSVSRNGVLAYLPGQTTTTGRPIQWIDHEGHATLLRSTPANWFNLRFSPDGRRLALQINEGQNDIWIYEESRDKITRLTFDPADDRKPVWTPDGRRITFASGRADPAKTNLYWQAADGTGEAQRLTDNKQEQQPGSWHPSGKFLAFEQLNPETGRDLMILPMQGDEASGWKPGTPTVFLKTAAAESEPTFSPDGRWLAYVSGESGRPEVYVRPFPGPGGVWLVSTLTGVYPTWSRTKRELFYSMGNGQIMVAAYAVEGDSFQAEKPRVWVDWRSAGIAANRMFDLHPDGERFAITPSVQTGGAKQDHLTFVFNLFEELRRIAPPAR